MVLRDRDVGGHYRLGADPYGKVLLAMGRIGRNVLLLSVSTALALGASEVALRTLGRYAPPAPEPVSREPDLYQFDPDLGYTLKPLLRTTYRYPRNSSRDLSLIANSDGFRNGREFDEPDGRPRIWVLGDSMVEGSGVEAGDRFTEVVERLQPDWRVDSMGVSGWGLDLMVRAFEHVSQRLRPDVLVVAFYTDDFRRLQPYYSGVGYPIPKFELVDGSLVSRPFPRMAAWRRLRVVQAVEQRSWRSVRNRFDLNGALLDRLLERSRPDVELVVVFLPGRGDTDEDKTRRGWLRAWCDSTETPFLDLTETIHGAGVPAVFIPDNPHLNEQGHRIAGEAIRTFLAASSERLGVPGGADDVRLAR